MRLWNPNNKLKSLKDYWTTRNRNQSYIVKSQRKGQTKVTAKLHHRLSWNPDARRLVMKDKCSSTLWDWSFESWPVRKNLQLRIEELLLGQQFVVLICVWLQCLSKGSMFLSYKLDFPSSRLERVMIWKNVHIGNFLGYTLSRRNLISQKAFLFHHFLFKKLDGDTWGLGIFC